jgi:cobalt/nickel transport system ATP-binding protein
MSELFKLEDVTFAHNPNIPPVLDGFNLTIEGGKRTAILGANGAGKTTLFYTLTGVYQPQGGQVLYNGSPIEYTKDGLRDLRSDVAVVLQNPDEQIFCSLVEEDVAFGPLNLGLDRDEVEVRVGKALRDMRISEYARRPLQQLSGGQRKRVAIAGALAMNPKIMIMDEPTAGLDPQASMEVMELAEKLRLNGVTVLISTHDIDLVYRWADVSDVLNKGKIEFTGDADEFYANPEVVYGCGLLIPSVFGMNRDVSFVNGINQAPYPHSCCELTAKFGKPSKTGKVYCVPAEEEEAAAKYDAVMADLKGVTTGVYGPDARYALREKDVEFRFDAMDACFLQAVEGKDVVLFYDPIYDEVVLDQAKRLGGFGVDVQLEVIR